MPIGANLSDVGAGSLRELFAFDKREFVLDMYGNQTGAFAEQFRDAAARLALKGGEGVQASRLEGRQPFNVTVRYSALTASVTTDWRCRDTRTGQNYAIVTHVPRARRDYIDMIVSEGIADAEAI